MYKSLFAAVAFSLCSLVSFSAPSFANQSNTLMANNDGVNLGTTKGLDSKYPVNPKTGKRTGIPDWEGTGLNISQHPDSFTMLPSHAVSVNKLYPAHEGTGLSTPFLQ